jgi:pSer/pThr/pTyr-binding forkhead associated (FHA) protein
MQVLLTVVGGVHHGRKIPIPGPEFLIGRDAKCHLRPASADVSRQHCAILIRQDKVFLKDYGSSNGTILNRRMLVHGELQLEDGDNIQVGPLTFMVNISAASAKKPDEPVISPLLPTDNIIASDTDEFDPSPGDTVLIGPKLTAKQKSPGDAGEMLCS